MLSNYSFIDNTLAGSDKPHLMDDIEEYLDDGISHLISLTPDPPLVSKYMDSTGMENHHIPVFATPDKTQLDEFVELMKSINKAGEKAVVHCQYGQERTGIFLAVYLIEVRGMSYQQAIEYLRKQRPSSLQTPHSIRLLDELYG